MSGSPWAGGGGTHQGLLKHPQDIASGPQPGKGRLEAATE